MNTSLYVLLVLILLMGALSVYCFQRLRRRQNVAFRSLPALGNVQPLDPNGNPVDWWLALKLPTSAFPQGGCCENAACPSSSKTSAGLCYLYADANNPQFTFRTCLGQPGQSDPLSNTLNQVWLLNGIQFQLWNDQWGDGQMHDPNNKSQGCNAPGAHSKGALAYDTDGNGWYLNLSTPYFPDMSALPPDNSLGCQIDNNLLLAQHFFCFSLDQQNFEALAAAMTVPNFCALCVPSDSCQSVDVATTLGQDISLAFAHDSGDGSTDNVTVTLQTRGGMPITAVLKGDTSNTSPWSLVATALGTDLTVVNYWLSEPTLPTLCAGDVWDGSCIGSGNTINGSSLYFNDYNVENVLQLTASPSNVTGLPGGNEISWSATESENHMKWGISTPRTTSITNPYLCVFGSMNQEGSAGRNACGSSCSSGENGRGGDFFAFSNQALWTSLRNLISKVSSCADDSRVADGYCTGGSSSPSEWGTRDTFWGNSANVRQDRAYV